MTLLVLSGPNLNLLGQREPEVYGPATLADLEAGLRTAFPDVDFAFQQHNSEGALIDALHQAEADGVVFNPGGYAHTSVALHDAVLAIDTPVVEVHLSNVHAREPFRQRLVIAPAAAGVIAGFGAAGYRLAVQYFLDRDAG
ncbi:MAG: type II 3-dehydroquinate dehydratase [Bacteroidota bacterium]